MELGRVTIPKHAKRERTSNLRFGNARLRQELGALPLIPGSRRTALADFRELLDILQHINGQRVKCALSAVKNL